MSKKCSKITAQGKKFHRNTQGTNSPDSLPKYNNTKLFHNS